MTPGTNRRRFDVLMGCDGARSRVRESQPNIFGDAGDPVWNVLLA